MRPVAALVLVTVGAVGALLGVGQDRSSAAQQGVLKLQQIDGGIGYYGRFSDPLPTSPDFFPIGVCGARMT